MIGFLLRAAITALGLWVASELLAGLSFDSTTKLIIAAVVLGIVYLVGRVLYLRSYVADPARREFGFGMSVLPVMALILGGLWGATQRLL